MRLDSSRLWWQQAVEDANRCAYADYILSYVAHVSRTLNDFLHEFPARTERSFEQRRNKQHSDCCMLHHAPGSSCRFGLATMKSGQQKPAHCEAVRRYRRLATITLQS